MPTPTRRRLRQARRGLAYTIAIALVLVALVLGVASQMLPLAERNPDAVAAWLSQRAGRTIAFDRVETEWTRRGPLLQLDNLRIGEGDKAFTVGDTEMLVSIYAGLLPGTPFSELRLRGLDLTLERIADGRWQVRGLPGQQKAGVDPFESLEGLGELQVIDGKLAVIAPRLGIDAQIPRIDLRLQVSGSRVRAGVRAWPEVAAGVVAQPVDAMLDLDRESGDGDVYAGARKVDLGQWSPLLHLMGVSVDAGTGRAEAWATLKGNRVSAVTVDAALDQLVLRGVPESPAASAPRAQFGTVESRARWALVDGGWRVDASVLRIDSGGSSHVMDGLLLAGGTHYAVSAQRVDVAPLLGVAALSDRLPPGLRRWIRQAQPRATLQDIAVSGTRGGAMHASARIEALGFDPVGESPGLHGLAGEFDGDADGFRLQLDPSHAVAFDWPSGFGVVHAITLDGDINGWRDGAGWRIGTAALAIDGDGFGANARGGLWWQGDGSRPWIDIATTLDDTALPVAKGFWVRNKMSDKLIDWLDTALVAGTLKDGRALVVGDLDDWPFDNNDGRFEATGHIVDATLRFQPDWPAAEHVDVDASFVGNGFSIEGTGALGEVDIHRMRGAIDHYRDGALTVEAEGSGDLAGLLEVLRQSPLRGMQPETFDSLSASGAAVVDFDLRLPLHRGAAFAINGDVELDGATLADPRWDLAFQQVGGRIEYDRNGFHADRLQVRHDDRPGTLSLRAGQGHVRAGGNAFEAGLQADFDADALIDRAPDLAWLKPHLDGRSRWDVGVTVPRSSGGPGTPAARLRMRSDLVGTALTLPEPLSKPAPASLAATIDTPLPMGSGDVEVGLGNLLALRARSAGGRTGVRIALGGGRVDQPPPVAGLVASGSADKLDAIEWIGLVQGGGEGATRMPLQRIDVTARRLQLLGGVFPDTRLLVVPADGGATAVRAEGDALQGQLRVPASRAAAISGKFERLHWKSATAPAPNPASATAQADANPAAAVEATTPAQVADADTIDPASIPPLSFDIDDLRIVDARLGSAKLRTRPTPAGLQVEQFTARAPDQSIDVTGGWTGRGAAARTRLSASLASKDFGAMLDGFGYGGRLAGGEGEARLDAGWSGSPADFNVAGLDGSLTVNARDGRLLEVEPGAGRVLGLLSIAELPRRLSLDFRDFFSKGFAFNEITGAIKFADGSARSDDLRIDGPAAEISIRGAANLRDETFNQTVEVVPKAGNLLTAVGAIAAGPVGAAIGAAANAVLQKPLGLITARTYKVTGPWAEPRVEVISREQGRALAPEPPVEAPADARISSG
ncbi:YhdP family protein [Lysobacter sp. F6437]|uniref:YhdP family protein n=1 Tax=Lysobacter sp. F6437 TaxID=3459296 RepID=UPI00403E1F51